LWLEGCSGWRAIWYSGWRAIVPAGPRADAKTHACTKTHACVTGHRAGPRDACDALPTNFLLVWFGLVWFTAPVRSHQTTSSRGLREGMKVAAPPGVGASLSSTQ